MNRVSIETHGLDWRHMGVTNGVAGGWRQPEVDGIYLCHEEWDTQYFAEMAISAGHDKVDVWEVSLPSGSALVEGDGGYEYFPQPISRDAIRLMRQDWTPTSRFAD